MRHTISCWVAATMAIAALPALGQTSGPGCLTGRVVDYEGRPVAGAEVTGTAYFFRPDATVIGRATTGADGTFALRDVPAGTQKITVLAKKAGLAVGWRGNYWGAAEGRMEIRLERPEEIAGTVVDTKGRPVAGARVMPVLAKDDQYFANLGERSAFEFAGGADGRFVVSGVPRGSRAALVVRAEGMATAMTGLAQCDYEGVLLFSAGRRDVRVVMEPEGAIAGQLVEKGTGRGIPGVTVSCGRHGSMGSMAMSQATTGADGRFRARGLAEGRWTMAVAEGAFGTPAQVVADPVMAEVRAGGTAQVTLEAEAGGLVTARVREASGAAVACEVELRDAGGRTVMLETDVDGVGRARMAAGTWTVEGGTSRTHCLEGGIGETIAVKEGQLHELKLTAARVYRLEGQARDAGGWPVAGAKVRLVRKLTEFSWSPTAEKPSGADGGFVFLSHMRSRSSDSKGWTPEDFEFPTVLVARQAGGNLVGARYLGEAPADRRTTVELRPGAVLSGQVLDPAGEPAPWAVVWVQSPPLAKEEAGRLRPASRPASRPGEGDDDDDEDCPASRPAEKADDEGDSPASRSATRPEEPGVFPASRPGGGVSHVPVMEVAVADGAGRFTFSALPPGGLALVWAAVPGQSGRGRIVRLPEAGGQVLSPPVQLVEWRWVTGAVVDESGKPVAGAKVWCSSSGCDFGDQKPAVADAEGKFRVLVPPGRFSVTAAGGGNTNGSEDGSADTREVKIRATSRPAPRW